MISKDRLEPGKEKPGNVVPLIRNQGGDHGSHWRAVCSNMEELEDYLKSTSKEQFVTKLTVGPYSDMGSKVLITHKGEVNSRVSTFTTLVEVEADQFTMATAYPVLWSKKKVDFKILKINEWPFQIEAILDGQLKEASLSFFPIDFFLKRSDYQNDEVNEISLGAFAYQLVLEPLMGKEITPDSGPYKGRSLSPEKAQMILPMSMFDQNSLSDDHRITGTVLDIQSTTSFGQPAHILTIEMQPLGELEVFCLESKMQGVPEVGQRIGAVVWLQGREPSEEYNVQG